MIVRIANRVLPFAQISNAVVEDKRLSWRARGILCYLLSKPDGWKANPRDIEKRGPEGRDAVRKAMAELQAAGYAELRTVQRPKGALSGREWVIYESRDYRQPENPSFGKPLQSIDHKKCQSDDNLKTRPSENPTVEESADSNTKEKVIRTESKTDSPLTPMGEEGGKESTKPVSEEARAIATLFHRKPSARWNTKEIRTFKDGVKRGVITLENIATIRPYHEAEVAKGKDGRHRRDIATFLHNFDGELDRARADQRNCQQGVKCRL